ncbi:RNA methyltransferase [uncultured Cetobacterium sp.]|uniref:TrmH family RNA methyltransferase n=1 Tax=uncultured Cetobacterium sp. TaxID=527638 RepID=UPI00262B82C8|nr:RNA methyltransferase [uncultured Cetobacterium sp.]
MEFITSKENETFKNLKKLRTKKYRDSENMFLAEGRKFLEFEETPHVIIFKEGVSEEILCSAKKHMCRKITLPEKLFKELTSQENSQGVIICYNSKQECLDKLGDNIVVLNRVSDPGNLGTIIRIADAAGFKDIILTKGSVDCYNEKTVRSTMGSILAINILYFEEERLVSFLKDRDYKIVVTALEKDSIPYTKLNLSEKNAFIFGNEGDGVSKDIIALSDEKVIIPIYGSAESLNVAMAAGIVLYEVRNKLENK